MVSGKVREYEMLVCGFYFAWAVEEKKIIARSAKSIEESKYGSKQKKKLNKSNVELVRKRGENLKWKSNTPQQW